MRATIIKFRRRRGEGGYILVTLMLFVALMAMALAAVLPELTFQMKRDREEEMVHRGVQYSRAVRAYYRKMGGYPPSVDLLESSNHLHFLRKRYKDPVTGQDFKFLHVTDVKLSFGRGIAGGQTLGKSITGTLNTASGKSTDSSATASSSDASTDQTTQDSSQQSGSNDSTSNSPFTSVSGQSAGQTFGGGPIVGVASTSTKESIRIYNKKDHYNDWQFIYDPTSDRGGLITGPYQPTLQAILPGQNGLGGMNSGANQGITPGTGSPGTQSNPMGTMQH
jgi:type II secretory pathway pseudopilin PulG